MDLSEIYKEPIHEVGIDNEPDWQPKGVILRGVITDDGYEYNFFNKSHKIVDSGGAWIYEVPSMYAWRDDMIISGLVEDNDQENPAYWLNSHMIIDLDTEDPYSIATAGADLGTHIDNLETPCFYGRDVIDIVNGIDNGDRIMFAVLYSMYYYAIDNKNWPYIDRTEQNTNRLWHEGITNSVNNGSRQWQEGTYEYITDWPGYPQGYTIYSPYYSMSHPGLVFECYKECVDSDVYTIKSCNGFDNHFKYSVSRKVLECILRGNHWGLQIFADQANASHISDIMGSQSMLDNFGTHIPGYDRYFWPLETALDADNLSDRNMISNETADNRVWIDPDTGTEYNTNELIETESGMEPIDTPYNYPVFMMVTGHIDRPTETHNGHPIFTEIIDGDNVEFLDHTDLIINKIWNDDLCRAFRPDAITFDLYIRRNNEIYYYRALEMREISHRSGENTWRAILNVPAHTSDDPNNLIDYVLIENQIPIPGDLIGNVTGGNAYTDITYSSYITIGGDTYGHPTSSGGIYSISVTNGIDDSGKIITGNISVTIRKIWANENCENCHMEISGTIDYGRTGTWTMSDSHRIVEISVPWDGITPNIFITENPIQGYYTTISHSDNCREWTIVNTPEAEPGRHPEDPSGHGDLFYFEMDPECFDWVNLRDLVGFAVEGGWGNGMEPPLFYKIVYLDDNEYPENTMVPGSEEYYNFLLTEWKRYWRYSGEEQKNAGIQKYSGGEIVWGPIVDYDYELRSKGFKVRIYIGAEMMHFTRLSRGGSGFKIVTLVKDKDDNYQKGCEWNEAPKKTGGTVSAPVRCGGWLGSLYNITSDNLKGRHYFLGSRWHIDNIILNGINSSFHKMLFISNQEGDGIIARTIHTDRVFNLDPEYWWPHWDLNVPERFALMDTGDDVYEAVHGNGIEHYDSYPGNNEAGSTVGDVFDRLFIGMENLVDASQLFVYKPYLDMQYHRTFMKSGLGFNEINPKVSHHTSPYLPYYDETDEDPDTPFAPFKDMYRGCKNLGYVDNYAIMCPQNPNEYTGLLGMHHYDGMFWGSGLKTLDISIPFANGDAPWGVCKGMFAGCRFDWVGTDLIENAVNIGGHAFRNMFRGSVVTFQTMPDSNQALNAFTFANTYFNADPWPSQQVDCILPRTQVWYGVYWGMFAYSSYHTVEILASSFNRWSFGYMFKNGMTEVIKVHKNRWYYAGDYKAHIGWVKGILCGNVQSLNQFCFYKPKSLAKYFGDNRIPKSPKWLVANYT